tara:strand:+ start:152 stop:337 length:186 start_codon:yes stop_codon:yes gene_type:complete
VNISPTEKERINHINYVMGVIHEATNQIYEHLIDREYGELMVEIKELTKHLKEIKDSIQDD